MICKRKFMGTFLAILTIGMLSACSAQNAEEQMDTDVEGAGQQTTAEPTTESVVQQDSSEQTKYAAVTITTDIQSETVEYGSTPMQIEVTLYNGSERKLSSEENIYLSYHILSTDGEVLEQDGSRSALEPVESGEEMTEQLSVIAPTAAGEYILEIDIVEEAVAWFSELGMEPIQIPLTVQESYALECAKIGLNSDIDTLEVSTGDEIEVPISITNGGQHPLYKEGDVAVYVSYHIYDAEGNSLEYGSGARAELPEDIAAGETVDMVFSIDDDALDTVGEYVIAIDLVVENLAWFNEAGMEMPKVSLTVNELTVREISDTDIANATQVSAIEDESDALNMTWRLIEQTIGNTSSQTTVDDIIYSGICAGNTYSTQFWVRDSATAQYASRYFNDLEYLHSWIELHLLYQEEDGSIWDWVNLDGEYDKNTVETDQETSLVWAACNYVLWTGNLEWLDKDIDGKIILERLEAALQYLLSERTDEDTGLLIGAHTIDWGDVELTGKSNEEANTVGEDTVWTVDIYDQSMFVLAATKLADVYETIGMETEAEYWADKADEIVDKTRKLLWNEDGYFNICYHLTECEHSFDENAIFGMGGNAMAVLAGIADEEMSGKIFETAAARQEEYGISTISASVLPAYPEGTFEHSAVYEEYTFQNGGQWDWFGARLITAMYQLGYTDLANEKLEEIAEKINTNQQINEWEDLEGNPCGSGNYAGTAGMLAMAIVEGKYGIQVTYDSLRICPQLENSGRIFLNDQATGYQIGYTFERTENLIQLKVETDYEGQADFSISLTNGGAGSATVTCNGDEIVYTVATRNDTEYVEFSCAAQEEMDILVTY